MDDTARAFLARAGWDDAQITPVAGDLSARQYHRLTGPGGSAILMDARALPESLAPFQAMTGWLRALGLSAPEIRAADPGTGFLLLEDLGQNGVGAMLSTPETRQTALLTAIDLLLHLRQARPPALTCPDAATLCDWTRLADAHYPGADPTRLEAFRARLETVLTPFCAEPATLSLRDFHADNLLWLPGRQGLARLGLLDYQDAFLTHPVYDLVSLLTDARSEIAPATRAWGIAAYAAAAGDDPDRLSRAFAAFSVQRNLRILAIFHRAARIDGKTHHLPKLPRVYGYLREAFDHPAFADLRPELDHALPPPEAPA
ncbi:MAG: phosphotransferase [Silicimonas sp.]|nr:phosphotransferase [Silicimonas sp.]